MSVPCPKCGHDPSARVVGSWSFWCDREIESLNAHRVNAGAKWQQAAYRRDRDAWQLWMRFGMFSQKILNAKAKRRVKIVRQYSGRQRAFDKDNLAGGCKQLVDAMVRAALLVDDSERWCEIEYVQRKADKSGTWILVEEIES